MSKDAIASQTSEFSVEMRLLSLTNDPNKMPDRTLRKSRSNFVNKKASMHLQDVNSNGVNVPVKLETFEDIADNPDPKKHDLDLTKPKISQQEARNFGNRCNGTDGMSEKELLSRLNDSILRAIHNKIGTEISSKTIRCSDCTKTFSTEAAMSCHVLLVHGVDVASTDDRFKCGVCSDLKFSTQSDLAKHEKSEHKLKRSYVCSVCGYIAGSPGRLTEHETTHTGEKPYSCDLCDKAFGCKKSLKDHKFLTHENPNPYICESCGKCFRDRRNYKCHKLIHTQERKHICEVCGKAFRHSGSYKIHLRSHTGEKPYKCSACAMEFRLRISCRRHVRHHEKNGEVAEVVSSLAPSVMGRGVEGTTLSVRPAVDCKCQFCGLTCFGPQSLQEHEGSHTGEKPFKCDLCGNCYRYKDQMRAHRRSHDDTNVYDCEVCGKAFDTRRKVKRHAARVHDGRNA